MCVIRCWSCAAGCDAGESVYSVEYNIFSKIFSAYCIIVNLRYNSFRCLFSNIRPLNCNLSFIQLAENSCNNRLNSL